MSDFQKSFSESTSSIKFDEKYIDSSVQPNDIGVAEQLADKSTLPILRKGLKDTSPKVIEIYTLLN